MNGNIVKIESEETLFKMVSSLIENSRKHIAKTISATTVSTYYEIGHYVVEYEQQGCLRASYGKQVVKNLSDRLTRQYGRGWSVATLTNCRKFYVAYKKSDAMHTISASANSVCNAPEIQKFSLSWNHYQVLMRIDDLAERNFYEIEAQKQNWDYRWLKRQVASSLYERIALSRDKSEVFRLALEGQTVEKTSDIIKSPISLEFVGLKPDESYSESKLENAIISKIQKFLLEMGKGFLFEARQKRFTFDEDNYYVDLVLYNRLLQCYVLIDLKIDKLTHQDLGQMQMYVNYFDRYVKQDFEKPTIGILLCKEKNDALVELTLPKDANVYAAAYQLYLPDKALLQAKVKEWIEEFEENEEIKKLEED